MLGCSGGSWRREGSQRAQHGPVNSTHSRAWPVHQLITHRTTVLGRAQCNCFEERADRAKRNMLYQKLGSSDLEVSIVCLVRL